MAKPKHWNTSDFIIITSSDHGEYGYCRKCKSDMQRFFRDGVIRHYRSHKFVQA